jgi:hypothetical protein
MLTQTKRTNWGPELDCTTTCWHRHFESNVFNVAKAWAKAISESNRGSLHVHFYGNGLRSINRKCVKMPVGVQCDFSFSIVRRGNCYTAVTRGPVRWSVNRSQRGGRDPKADKYLPCPHCGSKLHPSLCCANDGHGG